MKKPLLLLALAGLSAATLQAQTVIDFTSGEGYSNGNLNGQPTSGSQWTEQSAGVYQVDATVGTVSYNNASSASAFQAAVFGENLGAGTSFTQSMDFTFTRVTLQPGSNYNYTRLTLNGGSGSSFNGIAATLRQRNTATDRYDLTLNDNVAGNAFTSSTNMTEANVGLSSATNPDTSDLLRITMTTTFVSGNDWSTTAVLRNLTTDTELRSITLAWTADASWNAADKYLRLDTGDIRDLGTGASVTISQITAVPEPSSFALLAGGVGALLLLRRRRS